MTGRVALVTGISGFVGRYVARELRDRGIEVHGMGIEAPDRSLLLDGWHVADLSEPDQVHAVIENVKADLVVHLAGQSSAARSFENPVETFRINVLGTWAVLEAAVRVTPHTRIVVVGSAEAYGVQKDRTPLTERARFHPVSPYGFSKAAADALSELAFVRYRLDVIRTRSFAHTGPGQDPRFVIPSLAQQIANMEAGQTEPVLRVGNLEVTRDIIDVRDVARAYIGLLESGQAGEAYNVSRGVGYRLFDLARQMVSKSRVSIRIEVDSSRLRPADIPYLVGDSSAIERDANWRATIPIEQTLDDVLNEWRAEVQGVNGEGSALAP